MKKVLLGIFLINLSAFSQCEIESYEKIIKFNKVLDNSIIKKTDCSDEITSTFINFISNIEGKIPKQQLFNIFKSEHNFEVNFSPKTIDVIAANNFIEKNLDLKNIIIKNVRSLYGSASLNTTNKSPLYIDCSSCSSSGEKNLKLVHEGNQIWLSADFLTKRRAFSIKDDISPFKDILAKSILEEVAYIDLGNSQLFNDYENIKFYRANKNLQKGHVLKESDLTLKTLIHYNQSVEVIIKGEKIALKSRAQSRESGKLGDIIKLYNPKTKKLIKGKVIGFNKVLVNI